LRSHQILTNPKIALKLSKSKALDKSSFISNGKVKSISRKKEEKNKFTYFFKTLVTFELLYD
jgi:hypothetical protein